MRKILEKSKLESTTIKYSIIVETCSTKRNYETTVSPLINGRQLEPLIRAQSGTIILALETHKKYLEKARSLI